MEIECVLKQAGDTGPNDRGFKEHGRILNEDDWKVRNIWEESRAPPEYRRCYVNIRGRN
jgi:hypothetical protein